MMTHFRPALILLALFTILFGVIYPGIVTIGAQAAFPHEANGSLVHRGDRVVGSELIGQVTTDPRYFGGRPSATAYNGAASSGTNFGPLHSQLRSDVADRVDALRGNSMDTIPVDLVTSSASGLDPHISPAAANVQVARIAALRHVSEGDLRELVREYTEDRTLRIWGEPRVNVFALNRALDQRFADAD